MPEGPPPAPAPYVELGLMPVIGARIETVERLAFLAYPVNRAGDGRLCRLISAGRMATPEGEWQDKGVCQITIAVESNVVPVQFGSRGDAEA